MEKYSDTRKIILLLLFITGLLWIAFLFKVFFVTEAKEPFEAIISSPENQEKQPIIAKSRNKKSITKTDNTAVVKAVRESFEKNNPIKNDQIIRGKISKINSSKEQSKEKSEDLSVGILKMLNDTIEMRSLNKDYKQAIQREGKIFYQGHYY